MQRTFFPPVYQDHDISPQLKPGDKRVWSALKVLVELRDETSLHIPFREPSKVPVASLQYDAISFNFKDWQWDGLVEIPHRPRKREPAFFSLTIGDRSSISYLLPMVVGPSGYESVLEVHLDTMTITSSLNDIRLISAESSRVNMFLLPIGNLLTFLRFTVSYRFPFSGMVTGPGRLLPLCGILRSTF